MKQFFIIFSLSYCLLSCYKVNKPEVPENLISKDKMVNVIIDMSLFTSAKGVNKKKLQENGVVPENYFYEKHNIDSVQFALSSEYYAYNVEVYDNIYARVKDSLTALRAKYKAIEDKERENKKIKDSILKLKGKKALKKST